MDRQPPEGRQRFAVGRRVHQAVGAYLDDGVVRLEALVEGLVDELAEPPVCRWCAVEVFRTRLPGGSAWAHRSTGLLVCSGQVAGGWGALRQATPVEWRVRRQRQARPLPGRALATGANTGSSSGSGA